MIATTTHVVRLRAPSGNRDHDYFQARCNGCGWEDPARYSNRTVEGRDLAARNAQQHRCSR